MQVNIHISKQNITENTRTKQNHIANGQRTHLQRENPENQNIRAQSNFPVDNERVVWNPCIPKYAIRFGETIDRH